MKMDKTYYYGILESMQKLVEEGNKQQIEPQKELIMIRDIAAGELLKLGAAFHLEISEKKQEEAKKNEGSMLDKMIGTKNKQQDLEPDMLILDIDNGKYVFPVEELKRVFGKNYDALTGRKKTESVEKKEDKPAATGEIVYDTSISEEKNEQDLKPETPKPLPQEKIEETGEADGEKIINRLPIFGRDTRFKDDKYGKKKRNTFTCGRHVFHIPNGPGETVISLYIYPLRTQEDARATDIFVTAESNGMVRSAISKGKSISVSLEIANVGFILRGAWKNGEFVSQANIVSGADPESASEKKETIIASEKTSTSYVHIEAQDGDLYLFPARFDQNDEATGLAPAAIAVVSNGTLNVFSPTSEGSFVLGSGVSLICYWEGNEEGSSFCYQIMDS